MADEATEHFERAVELQPANPTSYVLAAAMHAPGEGPRGASLLQSFLNLAFLLYPEASRARRRH